MARSSILGGLALSLVLALAGPADAQCTLDEVGAAAPATEGQVGRAVAVEGETLFLGAPAGDAAFPGPASGTVHVLERGSAGWSEVDVLAPSDAADWMAFGRALDVEGDRLVVGAPGVDEGRGAVYVFERTPAGWAETAKLTFDQGFAGDQLGNAVALRGDVLVAGAWLQEVVLGGDAGAVHVFERIGGVWTHVQQIVAPDAAMKDRFGASLAFDGERLVVGADGDDPGGSVYVHAPSGSGWSFAAKLVPASTVSGDGVGRALALDGEWLLVGAPGDDQGGSATGAVHAFRDTALGWVESQTILASDAQPLANFGGSLAIDGPTALAGALGHDGNSGAAYVLRLTPAGWVEDGRTDPVPGLEPIGLGESVALDSGLGAAGAPFDDLGAAANAGSARVLGIDLCTDVAGVSLAAGGTQTFALDAGPTFAGSLYVLAGSASGTSPGFPIGGELVPLNPDPYLLFTVSLAGTPPLAGGLGFLDVQGEAQAQLRVPAGTDPALAGLVLHHAFAALDPATLAVETVSGAVAVLLSP